MDKLGPSGPSFEEPLDSKTSTRSILSDDFKAKLRPELRKLSELRTGIAFTTMLADWGVIAAAAAGAMWSNHWLGYAIAAGIIAGRQHAFLVLIHEAVHRRFSSNTWINDRLVEWALAYPFFLSMHAYRKQHFSHHQHTNSDKDPDWARRYNREDWQFPTSGFDFLKRLSRYAMGLGFKEMTFVMKMLHGCENKRAVVGRIFYYSLWAAGFSYFQLWPQFLALWMLPYFTLLPMLMRVRVCAEHFGTANSHELNQTRTVKPPLWEHMFFAPHHVNHHLEHHLFPSVPFYNLPKLHKLLMEHELYKKEAHVNTSYLFAGEYPLMQDLLMQRDPKEDASEQMDAA